MFGSVLAAHLFAHALGQLFNFAGFLDDLKGKGVLVGFGDRLLELGGELKQLIGVALEFGLALLVELFFAVVLHLLFYLVGFARTRTADVAAVGRVLGGRSRGLIGGLGVSRNRPTGEE